MNEWIYRTEMGAGIEWRISFELRKGTNMGTVVCLGHRESPEGKGSILTVCQVLGLLSTYIILFNPLNVL